MIDPFRYDSDRDEDAYIGFALEMLALVGFIVFISVGFWAVGA